MAIATMQVADEFDSNDERWLKPGDPAPWFIGESNVNPHFNFSSAGGRFIVLSLFGSASTFGKRLIESFIAEAGLFENRDLYLFGVSVDQADRADIKLTQSRSGMDIFWDMTGEISRMFGALPRADSIGSDPKRGFRPVTYILGLDLRILATILHPDPVQQAAATLRLIKDLPKPPGPFAAVMQAPVLILPNVFERDLCRRLIDGYQTRGGQESGFMREDDGKTVLTIDHRHKRRSDWSIDDPALRGETQECIRRRLVPEIAKAFQFKVSRMERHIVACYDAGIGGYFRPHRDNTTKGTAHRRFAVTINLNTDEYKGGDLTFPEFGHATFRAPTGGAVVFSCSLLHEALPVTKGCRYAYLPFLYDEPAALIRKANNVHLGDGLTPYRLEKPPQQNSGIPVSDRPMNRPKHRPSKQRR